MFGYYFQRKNQEQQKQTHIDIRKGANIPGEQNWVEPKTITSEKFTSGSPKALQRIGVWWHQAPQVAPAGPVA